VAHPLLPPLNPRSSSPSVAHPLLPPNPRSSSLSRRAASLLPSLLSEELDPTSKTFKKKWSEITFLKMAWSTDS
jgi:hypothetical protein